MDGKAKTKGLGRLQEKRKMTVAAEKDNETHFTSGCRLWEGGNLSGAFREFAAGVRVGEIDCLLNLGVFYECGYGVEPSLQKAIAAYRRSWSLRRSTAAAMNLADIFLKHGEPKRGRRWLQMAVDEGDGDAALELAKLLLNAASSRDQRRARQLLQTALKSKMITEAAADEAAALLKSMR